MTTPSTDSLKAAPATRPVEIDLVEAPTSASQITLGQGLPEGVHGSLLLFSWFQGRSCC